MKVYELIAALSGVPAGAEVEIRTLMTMGDFQSCPVVDCFDGEDAYLISGSICEIEKYNDKKVVLLK